MSFKVVEPKPDFPQLEQELVKKWYKEGIVDQYLHKNDQSTKRFSFMDGPITANNPMGVHHAWGRTYKDLWQKYKNMQGFKQRFQNGFDCQGLWVEVEVEKELGFKSKKDIEKFGIARFVELCKERVKKYSKIQTEQTKRLGNFMHWDHSYFTMSDENNFMIWYFLKQCFLNGWIYKGRDSVPWCPRCGTAISQHEMLTEDYQEVTHEAVYFQLPIISKGWEESFFVVWTTTPWTIPGNVALVVDPDKKYLKIKYQGKNLIVSQARANAIFLQLQKSDYELIKGKQLVGLHYHGPFDFFPRIKTTLGSFSHRVVACDPVILPVSETEGTGIVHMAPGAGSEDYQLGKKEKLPVIELINEQAEYLDQLDLFSGKNAKKQPELILSFLQTFEQGKYYFKTEKISHRYPICWRCKEELVWRVVDEWYIAMDKIDPSDKDKKTLRKKLIRTAKKIHWLPEFGLKRELDWLKDMSDWLISKKRYWGLALPIWECPKGHFEVIGSAEELKKKAVQGWDKFQGHSPHRPWIDEIKIKCTSCGQLAARIKDVGNPWLDAGIVNFSTLIDPQTKKLSYFTDKKYFHQWFPADFITESFPGQFKNWFYSLIVMSTVLENTRSFKTILGFGTLLGEDGRAMHKSWGNAIEFNEGADKIGVDVMRWLYVTHNPEKNLLFGYRSADEVRRKFHLLLWNSYAFFVKFANFNQWQPKTGQSLNQDKLKIIDRWLILKLNLLLTKVAEFLDQYNPFLAALLIQDFVQDLSWWYIRRCRDRVGLASNDKKDRNTCLSVLHYALVYLSQILAPFNPFISEIVYQNLTGQKSVHLSDWPKINFKVDNQDLLEQMQLVRLVCELGHSERKQLKIKVRQPLAQLRIMNDELRIKIMNLELIGLIKEELNVKQVKLESGKELQVEFDTRITPALKAEGEAREIVRTIQAARKKANLKSDQLVTVYLPLWPKVWEKEITSRTLTKKLIKDPNFRIE